MSDNFYERTAQENSDGSPLFYSDDDARKESETADLISKAWRCELRPFGKLCPVDFYVLRDGRLTGVIELKTRDHASTKYPTVYLNCRKWIALKMASLGFGVPALFAVRFHDGIFWINIDACVGSDIKIGGTARHVSSHANIEPLMLVPIAYMRKL